MRTIFILLDSLNRHYLNAYGHSRINTPNIDRLAARGVVFDNHYSGSLPCMPARREMWTGRLNFLECPWSPLQPFDECLVRLLREQKQTYSHMITDHYHYFQYNGMGYQTPFNTWEFIRGQEGDAWHGQVRDPEIPLYRGRNSRQDWVNRFRMNLERDEDYPTPQCFGRAIDFIRHNHGEDNWHLHVEAFDPHEPFVCPQHYVDMYNDDWGEDYLFDWPNYAPVDPAAEGPDAIRHIRNRYAGTVTMADAWLGKLLDAMDEYDMWKNTAVVLTTDHGHLLGEHGYWAKNYMFDYRELVHIPLIVAAPGSPRNGTRTSALTTTIDLMPTMMELHGATPSKHVQGKSIMHLLQREEAHHDAVLYGYFGKDINMTDGRYTYCRQPAENSIVHLHTAMPIAAAKMPGKYAEAETGKFLPQTSMPVYRVPMKSNKHHQAPDRHLLYDLHTDPGQTTPLNDAGLEAEFAAKMKELLLRYEAPECQFTRTGLDR
ncbi:MAG: sulfatase-like hydrolase/transferase [Paenibacillaceae bacterium]|jgi:arylsulfatase A-like enzyme|nr:sulfatase-like hydrolase/transferase [Paenibacillaceae bacterium]